MLAAALTGFTAAVVRVIANLALYFAVHTLFATSTALPWGPIQPELPNLATSQHRHHHRRADTDLPVEVATAAHPGSLCSPRRRLSRRETAATVGSNTHNQRTLVWPWRRQWPRD